ncbi:MAG: VacJ family lipoprotein [Zymomonas mobilis]|uniref:Phospholipid-binding lipoprotein MlaA n=1 Tax=Zymomonas mobilis TaxID=542 RepID=A0A542W394_ZYMMB|nr:VacJ family lipoprotein [Zymomonas mobilis]TQL18044.1 phospholipid-binding lipoprotein MlaA [Zymomonas mobilis]
MIAPKYLLRPSLVSLSALALLGGCTITPGTDSLAQKDPLEKFNRKVWMVNTKADKWVMQPVAKYYNRKVPEPVRKAVIRIFANLEEPFNAINNLLQGKPYLAGKNIARLAINSTVGIGGIRDPATKVGVVSTVEDFGQTMGRWGMNGGPYFVLPFMGPTTMRDAIGTGIAQWVDPFSYCVRECHFVPNAATYAIGIVSVVKMRAQVAESGADSFLESSLDPYAAARSAYLQHRHAQILDQDAAGNKSSNASITDADLSGSGLDDPSSSSTGDPALDNAVADLESKANNKTPDQTSQTVTPKDAAAAATPKTIENNSSPAAPQEQNPLSSSKENPKPNKIGQ